MTPDATQWCGMLPNGIPHAKLRHSAPSSRTALRMRAPRVTQHQQVTAFDNGCQLPNVRSSRQAKGARATFRGAKPTIGNELHRLTKRHGLVVRIPRRVSRTYAIALTGGSASQRLFPITKMCLPLGTDSGGLPGGHYGDDRRSTMLASVSVKRPATASSRRRLPPNLPLSTEHHGTARNATGHYVVDVVGFPEWCWWLGEYCQG